MGIPEQEFILTLLSSPDKVLSEKLFYILIETPFRNESMKKE